MEWLIAAVVLLPIGAIMLGIILLIIMPVALAILSMDDLNSE